MQIVFWGTRGSLPMNTPEHKIYGGNTSCVSVRSGEHLAIFDAGSGLIHLGSQLAEHNVRDIDICFSHFHSDHICGLPFFKPFFSPACTVRLHSFGDNEATLEEAVSSYLSRPIFPITLQDFSATVSFVHHQEDERLNLGNLSIDALAIPHPGGAHALRAYAEKKTFIYATDTEHEPGKTNHDLVAFMRNADLAIYDCTFDDSEFEQKRGWGHSTWQEGVRLAKQAEVKQFGVFHHEPERTDAQLADIERKAQAELPASFVTRDFLELNI